MTKLTREQWDAMTPDEQWQHVNQAPLQIGETVMVHSWSLNGGSVEIEPYRAVISEVWEHKGQWFFSGRGSEAEHWFRNWPLVAFDRIDDHA